MARGGARAERPPDGCRVRAHAFGPDRDAGQAGRGDGRSADPRGRCRGLWAARRGHRVARRRHACDDALSGRAALRGPRGADPARGRVRGGSTFGHASLELPPFARIRTANGPGGKLTQLGRAARASRARIPPPRRSTSRSSRHSPAWRGGGGCRHVERPRHDGMPRARSPALRSPWRPAPAARGFTARHGTGGSPPAAPEPSPSRVAPPHASVGGRPAAVLARRPDPGPRGVDRPRLASPGRARSGDWRCPTGPVREDHWPRPVLADRALRVATLGG